MTPLPLDQIGLHWRDHKSALWWLALLYRRPMQFRDALQSKSTGIQLRIGMLLLFQGLPYTVVMSVLGRLFVLGSAHHISWVAVSSELAFAIAFAIAGGIAVGIAVGIAFGIAGGITFGIMEGIVTGTTVTITFALVSLRVYYHSLHPFFIWPKLRGNAYPRHPVAWDDLCSVPFPGLDRLLAAYSEENRLAGAAEIERLIATYPAQRGQALRAKVRLVAREAGRANNLARLDEIVARLPEGGKGFLGQTRQVRQWVNEIAAQQMALDIQERPIFREPTARLLFTGIENFRHRISGFNEPLASEFRKAAHNWQEIARRQMEEAKAIVSKQPTPQVFRAGDPVDRDNEAFVPRTAIVGQVEQQVMLAAGCPGLVLYGRRRTGKSTVLRNLSGFLPPSVAPVVISMLDPKAFTSQDSFICLIAAETGNKAGAPGTPNDISRLYDFLTSCNSRLISEGKRLLLAIDEYELIDSKIAEGVFTQDLLRMVRESIQSHRNITWILSGSHEITELTGAPWTSYLVSARTIHVPVFKLAETRLLLTEPLKHSNLWQKGESQRPRFAPGFWGDGGIERIHEEAGGWPHLVQLIAEAVVDLINDEEASMVSPALLDRALANCAVRGHNVLYELMHRECTSPAEWDYLSAFRHKPEQSPPQDQAIYSSLRRREIITEENGNWRLRVPLMARWLRERG